MPANDTVARSAGNYGRSKAALNCKPFATEARLRAEAAAARRSGDHGV